MERPNYGIYMSLSLKNLLAHSLNFGLGSVLPQLIGFFLIPLYTRYLSPADYGILEMTTTLSIFLMPLMRMGIPGAVTRFYFDYRDSVEKLRNFITTVHQILSIGAVLLSLNVGIVLFFIGDDLFGGIQFWPYMVLAIIVAGFSANNQLQKKLIQNRLESRLNLILQVIFAFSNIGITLLLVVVFDMGALGSLLASAMVTIGFHIQAQYYLRKDIKGTYTPAMAKESFNYGIGILPHHLAINSGPLITKAILANVASLALLGVFSISLRFVAPLVIVATSLNTVLVPQYNENRIEGNSENVHRLIRQILLVSFVAYTLFVFIIPFLMKWSLPETYYPSIPMIPILAIAFVGRTLYHVSIAEVFYMKKTRFISIITIVGTGINVLVCILLVEKYGATALCWAFSMSFVAWAIMAYFYKLRVTQHSMYNKEILLFVFGSVIVTAIAFSIDVL